MPTSTVLMAAMRIEAMNATMKPSIWIWGTSQEAMSSVKPMKTMVRMAVQRSVRASWPFS